MTNQTRNLIRGIKKVTAITFLLTTVALSALAQSAPGGPCLLGVGNCAPNNPAENADPGRGVRYYDGVTAQQILRARHLGSRYLLVLTRYWDHAERCWVEERAWVSGLRASNGSRVAVEIGPSRKVFLRSNALTAPQVNQAEEQLQAARTAIYQWLKYQEQIAQHLQNPTYQKWAQQEYQRAEAWVNYYKQYTTNLQSQTATSAP